MANEIRRRVDFAAGGLSAGLTTGATTMTSDGLQDLPALAADEYFALSLYRLDAMGRVTQKEVVYMTAHSAAAGSGTIVRAREGTTAQAWNAGDRWSLTDLALDNTIICKSSTRPATPYEGMRIWERDTGQRMFWNGSNWVNENNFRMHAVGSTLYGGSAPAIDTGDRPFRWQGGTLVNATNASGDVGPINFPVAFPTGIICVGVQQGDVTHPGASFITHSAGNVQWYYRMYQASGAAWANSGNHRVNWWAVGW